VFRWKITNALVLGAMGLAWAATSEKPSVRVSPQTFMAGADVVVTCRVPRRAENRWVNIGIADYTTSGSELHGEDGPGTVRLEIKRVPCGVTTAFCNVLTNALKQEQLVTASLQVGGCEPH
jgi:hypothetical protein